MRAASTPLLPILLLHLAGASLYGPRDKVVVLSHDTFHATLAGRPHAWMVEFYASWCGYCQNLSPTFKELAGEMAAWRDVIQVAVIDCGDEENNQVICKNASIKGFPTIKYYTPNITRGDEGVNSENEEHTKEAMKEDVIDFIEDMVETLSEENNTTTWPNLRAINLNTSRLQFSDLWPEDNDETFVVVERPDSYVGKEVILGTWRRERRPVVVERMVVGQDARQVAALAKLGVTTFPSVLILNSHNQSVTGLDVRGTDAASVLRQVRNQAAKSALRNPSSFRRTTTSPEWSPTTEGAVVARGQSSIARRRYSVHLSDLEKTVLFALQNEVAVKEEINMAALTEFLDVLLLYFPPASRLQPILTELRRDMNSSSSEASRHILAIDGGPPVEWVGCRGSAPQFGGFPCGLWQLWHTLTIGHRQATMGRTVEEPRVVLRAMVTYVREFFTCRHCVDHFLNMVHNGTAVEEEVATPTEAVLFLWAAHNAVNERLMNDISEDPEFPKMRFPSSEYCPECWDEEDEPKEEEVVGFLHRLYSQPSRTSVSPVKETDFDTTSAASSIVFHALSILSILIL